jgi:hypothetical protein
VRTNTAEEAKQLVASQNDFKSQLGDAIEVSLVEGMLVGNEERSDGQVSGEAEQEYWKVITAGREKSSKGDDKKHKKGEKKGERKGGKRKKEKEKQFEENPENAPKPKHIKFGDAEDEVKESEKEAVAMDQESSNTSKRKLEDEDSESKVKKSKTDGQ